MEFFNFLYRSYLLKIFIGLFIFAPIIHAKPFFAITTTSSNVQINVDTIGTVTFQVFNNSGILTKNMVYDVNYPDNYGVSIAQGTTCGTSLRPFQSCTLKLQIAAGSVPRTFRLSPRVCTDRGVVCSVPNSDNRPIVQVIPVPLTLQVDNVTTDQHLQLRALILTNTGTRAVELNSISVTKSSNVQNQVEICNSSTSCVPLTGSQPSCSPPYSLGVGSSCLIWFRSLDLSSQALGNLVGTITLSIQTTPVSELNRNTFTVSYKNDLYVGGNFTSAGGVSSTNRIAKWSGSGWSALSTGITDSGQVNALSLFQYDLFLGGSFSNQGSTNGNDIVRWDGINYNALSTGIQSNQVNTLTVFNSTLIVAGNFTNIGGNANLKRVASWNGSSFNALATGISDNTVNASTVYQNELILGGNFTSIGPRIVSWNGSTFNALSAGINTGNVMAFNVIGSILYVGGSFTNQYGATGDRIRAFS